MTRHVSATSRGAAVYVVTTALLLLLSFTNIKAQTTSPTDGTTPGALTPGAPAGAYSLSDFDNIDLYNGNLNFALPLLRVGGRGSAQVPVMLAIEQHWQVRRPKPLPHCEQTNTCVYNKLFYNSRGQSGETISWVER